MLAGKKEAMDLFNARSEELRAKSGVTSDELWEEISEHFSTPKTYKFRGGVYMVPYPPPAPPNAPTRHE